MGALLTYALNKDNVLVHVDEVKLGAACQCRCPHCNSPLDAKNGGTRREHHFAHAHGHTCEGAYESAMHLLAKKIICEQGGVMLPDTNDRDKPTGFVKLNNIEVEKWDDTYKMRPDAEGILNDGRRILIEFLVTHKVTHKKYDSIIENNLLCVEFDLNWLELDEIVLKNFLTREKNDRKWIVKREERESSEGFSSGNQRNPRFDKAKDILKKAFDNNELSIQPLLKSRFFLSKFGYDICEVDANFRGFKTDLLLYRSTKNDKGFISINFRGRRRKVGAKLPPGLRVIDVFIRNESDEQIQARFSTANLKEDGMDCEFLGAWKKRS